MKKKFISSDKSKVQDFVVHEDVDKYLGNILGEKFKEYRKRWNKASRIENLYDFPLFLVFEPLWKCNLKCIMCLHSDPKDSALEYDGKMPWDMYVDIMSESKKHNCPSLTIGGHCEPLLDTRIVEMIALARESGFVDIMLNTNATLLNETISKELIESGLTRLRVGFDGATASTYEKIRVGANFEIVRNNIMTFVRLRNELNAKIPIVRISCVHLSKNDQEIDAFIKFWTPIADYVTVQRYRPHVLTEARSREKLGAGLKAIKNEKCSEPWERLYVRGNGDVYTCCQPAYGPKLGNVKENTLQELWHSKKLNNLRSSILDGEWDSIPTCKECMFQFFSS